MASLQEIHSQSYGDMPFDDFAKRYHQKFYGDMPFDAFMQKAGTPAAPKERTVENVTADPIKEEVRQELEKLRAKGVKVSDSATRQFLQGATFGAADEILAGLQTPIEMIARRTLDPAKAYNYAKAREDLILENTRKDNGLLGTGMELAGGLTTGTGAAKAGATFMKEGAGALSNAGRMAADGAVYGALTGFNEGSGVEDRLKGASTGGVVGGLAGGGIGLAAPVVSSVGRNTLGWVSANANPEKYASGQFGRALSESGKTPQQIAQEVANANAAGQPLTVADAMGNSGQRMLSVISRNPGEGRTAVVDFLEGRQAGQGRRIASQLAEALDAQQTAAQAERAMTAARSVNANTNYGAASANAGSVNVSPAIKAADDFLNPGASKIMSPKSQIADDSVEGIVRRARSMLTDGKSQLSDFDAAFRAKIEIDNLLKNASDVQKKFLMPVRNALDDALAKSSTAYAGARDTFRAQSKAIEAIEEGSIAARSGRSENTLQRFAGMTEPERQGFRIGYGDKLIEGVQGGAAGQNKARVFTSDALTDELGALSKYQGPVRPGEGDRLAKALRNENLMFETRNQALGGSRTADNLADNAAMAVSPEIIANIASGNLGQAAKNFIARSSDALSGNTAEVRKKLAEALLSKNANVKQIESTLQKIVDDKTQRDAIVRALLSGSIGGGATGVNATKR